jgi:8-oxo-dGTP pyrophosphatase MutT (NUDIX family)
MKNPWISVRQNIIFQNKFGLTVRDDDVITPSGKPGKYTVINGGDFVQIIAVDSLKKIVMETQWRYTVDQEFLEIPSGRIDSGEDPLTAAQRELSEETGITANKWTKMGEFWSLNGIAKTLGHYYLAQDLIISNQSHQEETEKITHKFIDYQKLISNLSFYNVADAESALGLLLAQKYL